MKEAQSTMRLWSFQAMDACEMLEKNGFLRTEWRFTPANWRAAYEWMAREMTANSIDLEGYAPIWAWHSCDGTLNAPPTMSTARNLLTDMQILDGVCVVEFDAPASLSLLSSYNRFNDLLDSYLHSEQLPLREAFLDMFEVFPIQEYDHIQAALPYLQMDWVLDIRHLDMKPDRWDYDWAKIV
ncbi:MAG: DUF3841 domain-containing protein [Saprospiraceae bacterium]|nr:DUF3841 domain-containing protein [Saprospiraceae bacterium]